MSNKKKSRKEEEQSSLPSAIKGTVGLLLTTLAVVIITMLFANSLFVSNAAEGVKTGRITQAPYYSVTTSQTISIRAPQTTTTRSSEDPYQTTPTTASGDTPGSATDENNDQLGEPTAMTVVSAVYLHPKPTSQSENLLVIPKGAVCKVYRNEGGWLYLDYNGQMGYAYYTFFSGNLPQ